MNPNRRRTAKPTTAAASVLLKPKPVMPASASSTAPTVELSKGITADAGKGIMDERVNSLLNPNQENNSMVQPGAPAAGNGSTTGGQVVITPEEAVVNPASGNNITINLPQAAASPASPAPVSIAQQSGDTTTYAAQIEALTQRLEAAQQSIETITKERDAALEQVAQMQLQVEQQQLSNDLITRLGTAAETARSLMQPVASAKLTPAGFQRLFGEGSIAELAASFENVEALQAHVEFVERTIEFQQACGSTVVPTVPEEQTAPVPKPADEAASQTALDRAMNAAVKNSARKPKAA